MRTGNPCNAKLYLPLLPLLLLAAGATGQGDAASTQSDVISNDQLASDNAKHLPIDNEVGRIDPAGDLLRKCAADVPTDPELQWFIKLSPAMRDEVVTELNRYVFILNDTLLVKARLKDDYDMRWRFADKAPRTLKIQPPDAPSGKTKTLKVSALDVQTSVAARGINDTRRLKVQFIWQSNPESKWNAGEKIPGDAVQFTLPLEYHADCWIINHVPHREDSLGGVDSLEKLPNGKIRLTVADKPTDYLTLRLVLNGKDESATVVAQPGDSIDTRLTEALGAGASGYKFLGEYDGSLRFEIYDWFYDIGPASRRVIDVRPYNRRAEKATATRPSAIP